MQSLFISCPKGLEELLKNELLSLGFEAAFTGSGFSVPFSMQAIYKINYCSRLATRVLLPISEFRCRDQNELYAKVRAVRWSNFLSLKKTFAIDANVINHPGFNNSHFAGLIVKDAICDQFREQTGERPNVEVATPDVQLNLFINGNTAILSIDTSGAPLYKRGWRKQSVDAPLQESLAAALLLLSGFDGKRILCDPFCGSGTLLVEAAMIATHTPAGFYRKAWGFLHLPDFNEQEWLAIKKEADNKKIALKKDKIIGSDQDPKAIDIAYANLREAGFEREIPVLNREIARFRYPLSPSLVVTNPPYGLRLDNSIDIFKALGKFIQERCTPKTPAYVLCPETPWIKETGLELKSSHPFISGGLDVVLHQLELPS